MCYLSKLNGSELLLWTQAKFYDIICYCLLIIVCIIFILNHSESVEVKLELVVSVHLTSSVFIFSLAVTISQFKSRGQGQFFFFIEEKLKVHNVVLKKEIQTQVTFTIFIRWWWVWFHRLVWYAAVLSCDDSLFIHLESVNADVFSSD